MSDWRDVLTAKQLILLAIQSYPYGVSVAMIRAKLLQLGVHFKASENEIRARISELRKDALVFEMNLAGLGLTSKGIDKVAEITPSLTDEELEAFSQ